jgi:hypothetical protein
LGEDGSVFSRAISGAPVRLRIGREDVGAAEGIEVGDRVEVESVLGDNMGGEAPRTGDGAKIIIIEIVAISTKHSQRLKWC